MNCVSHSDHPHISGPRLIVPTVSHDLERDALILFQRVGVHEIARMNEYVGAAVVQCNKTASPCGSDASAIWWWFTTTFGISVIDAFYGDRERAVFESSYPAFGFQIPEMKLQMLTRTA